MIALGIESSCDETAVSILRAGREDGHQPECLAAVLSSQIELHRQHGGVVPELASRNHSVDLPRLVRLACQQAGIAPQQVDVYAATAGPGLLSALLVGNTTAKALSLACGKPFVSVNHLEGHLLSPFFTQPSGVVPHLGLVVSGGHTLFVEVRDVGDYSLLGRSLDDAAGEAFDKVGKMLELPYPGGPEIDRLAPYGDPTRFSFPRAMRRDGTVNVSFSGLKTAVLYTLPKVREANGEIASQTLADLCASFQRAVIDVLVDKAFFAQAQMQEQSSPSANVLALSGGVACNTELRSRMEQECHARGVQLVLPAMGLTTDNATMIAYVGMLKALRGQFHSLNAEVSPNLQLTTIKNRAQG